VTLPPSLSELDSASDDEPELSRITILVGDLLIDVGLPSRVSISTVIGDVIDLANDQLRVQTDLPVEFDNVAGRWTLARLTGGAIDPERSLAEAGVHDGELLVVGEVGTPESSLLLDDLEGMTEFIDLRARWFIEHGRTAGWFAFSIVLAVATALLLPGLDSSPLAAGVPITAVVALIVGVGCAVGAGAMPYWSGDTGRSTWLAAVALPLIFGGSLYIVPNGHGVRALPMALALTALFALLQLLTSDRGRSLYTAVITLAVFGAPAAVVQLLLGPNERVVGAMLAAVAVIVVYLTPRATIMLSRLPVPRVPTAGEPLDDIETQGGTAVEGVNAVGKQIIPTEAGMIRRVRRARERLIGIVTAATILATVGCYLALDLSDGFFWPGTAFAFAVATVLCLRGRSHHDLIQSAALIGGGLVIALTVIIKTATYVPGWQIYAAVTLIAFTALVAVCGLVAPRLEFSPVLRRLVEVAEYVAIAMVFPLAGSIIRIYAFFRGLRI
jgi:type VII secretion integral membrane protein EccD